MHEEKRELKGYLYDDEGGGKAYLDSGELREIAASCIEVANWLEDRADKAANVKVRGAPVAKPQRNRRT